MSSQSEAKPIGGLDVIADINRFQGAMREEMAGLPPSPAKTMMESAFTALVPLLGGLMRDYPAMISAFQKQRESIESTIETAKQNVAKAKENLAKVPPVDVIQKNITPASATLPPGITKQFGAEMMNRYLPQPINANNFHGESTAWQDWSITQ
jgi:hypothetical protein